MLDELDALMERMLSLPVEGLDSSLPAPPPVLSLEEPPAAPAPLSAAAPGLEVPAGLREPAAIPLTMPDAPAPEASPLPLQGPHMRPVPGGRIIVGRLSAPPLYSLPAAEEAAKKNAKANERAGEQPAETLPESAASGSVGAEFALPESPPAEVVFSPLLVKPPVRRAPSVPRRRRLLRSARQLLLRLNQAFDQASVRLGSSGKWLRAAGGRGVLGFAGLALIALAIAWCLHDWFGWTWFKVSVE
jgi:hypothetical protein